MYKTCPRCGETVDLPDRFCRYCGAALSEDEGPDTFIIKSGSARLCPEEAETPPPQPVEKVQAEEVPLPPAQVKPSRRALRVARKIRTVEARETGEEYVYPAEKPKKRGSLAAKFFSLLAVLLLIALFIGGLFLYQRIVRSAFVPVEMTYENIAAAEARPLQGCLYPALYTALEEDGRLESADPLPAAKVKLRSASFLRGEEKDAFLSALQQDCGLDADPFFLVELRYTVTSALPDGETRMKKTAYAGNLGARWYLFSLPY